MPSSYPRRKNRASLYPGSLPSSQLAPEEDQEAQRLQMEADDAAIVAAENKKSQDDGDYTPSQRSVQSSQSTDADDEDEDMPNSQPYDTDGSETAGEDEQSTRASESQPAATSSQEMANLHKQRLARVRKVIMLDECNSPSRKALVTKVLAIAWGVDEGAVERMAKGPVGRTEG